MSFETSPLVTRRDFLGQSIVAGALLYTSGFFLSCRIGNAAETLLSKDANPSQFTPNVFVHISASGKVTLMCHRSEMGQGVRSSLPVLIADELGADPFQVEVVQADGDASYGDQNTDGSSSVRADYTELRQIGAVARIMLTQAAANRWMADLKTCVAREGFVIHSPSQKKISFGELAEEAAKLPIPDKKTIVLRPSSELKHVGTDLPLIDAEAFVRGQAQFGADVHLPEMLIAVIARPPVVGGTIERFNFERALKVPGVKQVIVLPVPQIPYIFQPWGGVAVLAENTWAALRGRAALEITWNPGPNGSYDSLSYKNTLTETVKAPGKILRKTGNVEKALAHAARTLQAVYRIPHLSHASMEPPVAIAQVKGDKCEVWAPTQDPQGARKEAARILKIPEENVQVHVTFLGGAFGRKAKADFVSEAAFLAKEAKVPVRVQWTREDDIQHDYYHSTSVQQLTAGMDQNGKLIAWRHRTAFPPIGTLFGAPGLASENDLQQGVTDSPLHIAHVQAEACAAPAHVRIGWLRSVYNIFHSFSVNSFIDELAFARNIDPKQMYLEVYGPDRKVSLRELGVETLQNYRGSLTEHPIDTGRYHQVLRRVTEMSGWEHRHKNGLALGLAVHRSFLTYVAAVVSLKKTSAGKIYVDEAWVSADAGKVINRDRVRSQLEGAVVFGMSIAFYGAITMKDGKTEQSNFDDYRVIRMAETPRKIHVDILCSEHAPGGVGEPGVPPIAPAIANALFALTGKRVRDLPLSKAQDETWHL